MTPIDEILLTLLRRDWEAQPEPGPRVRDEDWPPLIEASLRHGVAGLLCRSLVRSDTAAPDDVIAAAADYLERAEAAGERRLSQLFDVIAALAADGVDALVFKGAALGMLAHGSATLRPNRDIDVLVHRRDMTCAVSTLHRLGYRARDTFSPRVMESYYDTYGQIMVLAQGRTAVEPHCAFAPHVMAVDLDMEGIWRRAVRIAIGTHSVKSLAVEDTLLTACVHGTKEKWWRLLWVADIAALAARHPSLDYESVVSRARAAGVLRMLMLGLALARDLFATQVPSAIAGAIESDEHCLRLLAESKAYLFNRDSAVGSINRFSTYHLLARERFADRARYLFRLATTPGENHFRMFQLPGPLVRGYPVVKVVHDFVLLPIWNLGKRSGLWRERTP